MKLLNHYIDSQIKQHQNVVCTLLEDLVSSNYLIVKSISTPLSKYYKSTDITESKPDVHLIIDRKGEITQLIPFNKQVSGDILGSWDDTKQLKPHAIVIALENHGRLTKQLESYFSWEKTEVSKPDVFGGIHRNEDTLSYWEKYPKSQTLITEKVSQCLVTAYKVKYILGYEEVCPGLKVDPGPAFPLEIIKSKLMKEEIKDVNAPKSIKSLTELINLDFIVADSGLKDLNGKEAKIINIKEKSGGWYKVNVDLGGFIKEEWVNL